MGVKLASGYYWVKHYNHNEKKIYFWNGECFESFKSDSTIPDEIDFNSIEKFVVIDLEVDINVNSGVGFCTGLHYDCPKCGESSVRTNHKFCPKCGIKINWVK